MSEFEENQLTLTQLSVEETEDVNPDTESAEEMGASQKETSGDNTDPDEGTLNVQSEDQPVVVDMSAITASTQERENLSKFQHIVDGFFAQTKEPALTISGKTVTVNAAAVRLFPTVDYGMLSAQDGTYINVVKVVHDPEIPYDAVAVENNIDRRRYILITLIPDVDLAYELNFPIIQTMGVMALSSWEFGRAATLASQFMAKINLVDEPVPPILDNAVVEWISLYVGRTDFHGGDNLEACCDEKVADPWNFDIHLYEARKMADNPLIRKLVDAYDADYAGA